MPNTLMPAEEAAIIPDIEDLSIEIVPISHLIIGHSPRCNGEKREHVLALAEAGGVLPPIIVHRQTMRVIDGLHRVRAAKLRGEADIRARFFDGSEASAFVLAVQANVTHGLPLSRADRRAAAGRIIAEHPEWSDRLVASVSGLSPKTVSRIRACCPGVETTHLDTRIGLDGRNHPVAPASRRKLIIELILRNPDASLRRIAREARVSPETVRDIRTRLWCQNPHAPEPRSATTAAHAGGKPALDLLASDPSFRMKEAGRLLLRVLNESRALHERADAVIESLPPHCKELVVRAARECTGGWTSFVERIKEEDLTAGATLNFCDQTSNTAR